MIAFLQALVNRVRRALPVGRASDRAQWRQEMRRQIEASQRAQRHNEQVIHQLSIQGRIAGDYRRDGRR